MEPWRTMVFVALGLSATMAVLGYMVGFEVGYRARQKRTHEIPIERLLHD